MDLALNNSQGLISHKTQRNQTISLKKKNKDDEILQKESSPFPCWLCKHLVKNSFLAKRSGNFVSCQNPFYDDKNWSQPELSELFVLPNPWESLCISITWWVNKKYANWGFFNLVRATSFFKRKMKSSNSKPYVKETELFAATRTKSRSFCYVLGKGIEIFRQTRTMREE